MYWINDYTNKFKDLLDLKKCNMVSPKGENLMIYNLVLISEMAKMRGEQIIMIFIDLVKVFDSVS